MKRIYIAIVCFFPLIVFGQNFKFKVSGGLNYSSMVLSDRINQNALSNDDIQSGDYDWYFETGGVNSTFNQYRKAKPKIGYFVNGIGNLHFTPNISLRLGTGFQYVKLDREISQKVVTFGNEDDYQTTLKYHDITLTIPLAVFYVNLPLGLEYSLKKENISFFGGVNFSARIFDKNIDHSASNFSVSDGTNVTDIFTNPIMEEFFWAISAGVSYEIRNRINIEIMLRRGMSNMLDVPNNFFNKKSNISTTKGIITNEEESLLKQLSVGVSYQIF
ncbi:MAG: hypothetical protein ACI85Q_002709 [Salibacteraceae bacterium]|jgi:hypothetical protein